MNSQTLFPQPQMSGKADEYMGLVDLVYKVQYQSLWSDDNLIHIHDQACFLCQIRIKLMIINSHQDDPLYYLISVSASQYR